MHKYTKQVFYAARRNMARKVICLFFSREMPDLGARSASSLIEKCQFTKSTGFDRYFSALELNVYLCIISRQETSIKHCLAVRIHESIQVTFAKFVELK